MSKRINVEVPEEVFEKFVAALDGVGLHVIEYVKSGGFRFQVSQHAPIEAWLKQLPRDPDYVPEFLR